MSEKLPVAVMVRIVGEPFLAAAKEYKAQSVAADKVWTDFAKERGAHGLWSGTRLTAMAFNSDKVPYGWKAIKTPARMRGFYEPVKGHAEKEALAALPTKPSPEAVFGDAIVDQINYRGSGTPPEYSGGGCVGHYGTTWVGWLKDVFYARIPHAGNAALNHLATHPGGIVDPPAMGWTVPEGLEEISDAVFDLDIARFKVEAEEAKKAGAHD